MSKIRFNLFLRIFLFYWIFSLIGCTHLPDDYIVADDVPPIFPDYTDVTIPVNIAPLNFRVDSALACKVLFSSNDYQFIVSTSSYVDIPFKKWKKLLKGAQNDSITVSVFIKDNKRWIAYNPFTWHVSSDSIDSHLVYRLIEPTYANWNEMGIYQRDLSSFIEKEIISNNKTDRNCMNCHAFNQGDPEQMVMHMRKFNAGTILRKGDQISKLDTKTEHTISHFVYPYWHPDGNDIAFSTNHTHMSFFESNFKPIEVYDSYSDIVIYNIDRNEVYTSPLLSQRDQLENFPVFSPDGKSLYFCVSPRIDSLPQNFKQIKYSLCRIGFNSSDNKFDSKIDTLIDLRDRGLGVSLPSVSPDGRYLICSVARSGAFLSWERDADLYLYDLNNETFREATILNSSDSESCTYWSSNSRWIVFSSKRLDGLHNRLFIAHINKEGDFGKPFLLPQKDPNYNKFLFKAYNLPQFIVDEVTLSPRKIADVVKGLKIKTVEFSSDSHKPVEFDDENIVGGEVN